MPEACHDLPTALGAADVHLWCLSTGAPIPPTAREPAERWLSDEERARHGRFLRDTHRDEFLSAHALLRGVIARYTGVAPSGVVFSTGPHGRPELAGPAGRLPLRFNLSHTGGLVVCGVALGRDIGVDVEHGARARNIEDRDIAHRFFAPAEALALDALPADERRRAFFDYWTLKEAYVKARGLGLALPLDRFAFTLDGDVPRVAFLRETDDDPAAWHFQLLSPTPSHHLAVAVRRGTGETIRPRLIWTSLAALVAW